MSRLLGRIGIGHDRSRGVIPRAAGLSAILLFIVAAASGQTSTGRIDPFPIQRIQIPADRVAAELAKVNQGTLVELTPQEFEGRLQKATRVEEGLRNPPHLVKAEYTAKLSGNALVQGKGTWTFQSGASPAIFPLKTLNLALEKVHWQSGADAVLGEFPGKNPGLWVENSGTLDFAWSGRGTPEPNGLVFDVELPPCALASLDLILPDDYFVSVKPSVALLRDSVSTEDPGTRMWRLQIGGCSRVEFTLRRNGEQDKVPPLVLSRLETKGTLLPEWSQFDFDFNVEILNTNVRQLTFELDDSLKPYQVIPGNADILGWESNDTDDSGHRLVKISLREPFHGTLEGLTLRCLASQTAGRWAIPWARLQGSRKRGETVKLRVSADVVLEQWHTGSFHLIGSTSENDGGQTLTMIDSPSKEAADERPSAFIGRQTLDINTTTSLTWNIGTTTQTLKADITHAIVRGVLHQAAIKFPSGAAWHVDDFSCDEPNAIRSSHMAGNLLLIELRDGFTPRTVGKFHVSLSAPLPRASLLPIPDVETMESTRVDGALAISCDSSVQLRLARSSIPATVPRDSTSRKVAPLYYFEFHDRPVFGRIEVLPLGTRVQAHVKETVSLKPERAVLDLFMTVEPVVGNPVAVDFQANAPIDGLWRSDFQDSDHLVESIERRPLAEIAPNLLAFGNAGSFQRVVLAAALPAQQQWRIHLTHPLLRKESIHLRGALAPLAPRSDREKATDEWRIPLVFVNDVLTVTGEVSLRVEGVKLLSVSPVAQGSSSSSDFDYGITALGFPVRAVTMIEPLTSETPALFERVRLTSYVESEADVVNDLEFEVWNWSEPLLPVVFSETSKKILAIRVDGHWLDHFEQHAAGDAKTLVLPVDVSSAGHRYEVLYTTTATWKHWPFFARLSAAGPKLPLSSAVCERIWRIRPGMQPVSRNTLVPHSQTEDISTWHARDVWHGADAIVSLFASGSSEEMSEKWAQALASALPETRSRFTRDATLADVIDFIDVTLRRAGGYLVIDRTALRNLGFGPDSSMGFFPPQDLFRPFLETAGMQLVATKAGMVLTSAGSSLQRGDERDSPFRATRVADALRRGSDATGRLVTASQWLLIESATAKSSVDNLPAFAAAFKSVNWSEWRFLSAPFENGDVFLVNGQTIHVTGVLLAFLMLFFCGWAKRFFEGVWHLRLLLLALAALFLAVVQLPAPLRPLLWWPGLALVALLCFWYVNFLRCTPSLRFFGSKSKISTVTALLAVGGSSFSMPARAQIADPFTVYYIEEGQSHPAAVLATPELLKKLSILEDSESVRNYAPVIVSASYSIKLNTQSEVNASFNIFSFAEQSKLIMPLSNIELREGSTLDREPVYPTAAQPGKTGYQIAIKGKGFHRLVLPLSMRSVAAGEYQETRVAIPRVFQSSVEAVGIFAMQELQLTSSRGEESLAVVQRKPELKAQLGSEALLQLRWRLGMAAPATVTASVRELHFWDLQSGAASLSSVFQYSISRGATARVAIALPDGTDVRTVEASAATSTPSLVRQWSVIQRRDSRLLQIDLTAPQAGKFDVRLELLPLIEPTGDSVLLKLPTAQGVRGGEGFLAYRTDTGDASDKAHNLGTTNVSSDVFAEVWAGAGMHDLGKITHAYSFRQTTSDASLTLTAARRAPAASVEQSWFIQPRQADVSANFTLTSPATDVTLIELLIPSQINVTEVRGPQIHHWTRQESTIQIWLQQPRERVSFTLSGWTNQFQSPTRKDGQFRLPVFELPGCDLSSERIVLQGSAGLRITPAKLSGLVAISPENPLAFRSQASSYEGVFSLHREVVPVASSSLTTLQARDGNLLMLSEIRGSSAPYSNTSFQLTLHDWRGEPPVVETNDSRIVIEAGPADAGLVWKVSVPAGVPQPILLSVRGKMPMQPKIAFRTPHLELSGTQSAEHWLALLGNDFRVKQTAGMTVVKEPAKDLVYWRADAQRIQQEGTCWAVKEPWSLVLEPRASAVVTPVTLVGVEQEAVFTAEGHWEHQAHYQFFVREDHEVEVTLPEKAHLIAVAVDAALVNPRRISESQISVPLRGENKARLLHVQWAYSQDDEQMTRPIIAPPTLAGMAPTVIEGKVVLPPTYQFASTSSAARNFVSRAQAAMRMSVLVAETASARANDAVLQTQKQFCWYAHLAETELDLHDDKATLALLKAFRADNALWAKQYGYQSAEKQAALQPPTFSTYLNHSLFTLPQEGSTAYWVSNPTAPSFRLTLREVAPAEESSARRGGWLALAAFLVLFGMSYWPKGFRVLLLLWPENVVFWAIVITVSWGFSLLGSAMILLGLGVRSSWLLRQVRQQRPLPT